MHRLWIAAAFLLLTLAGCTSSSTPAPETPSPAAVVTPAAPAAPAAGAVVYTCPMHPEVTSNKPGKCPKCNMDLVVKK